MSQLTTRSELIIFHREVKRCIAHHSESIQFFSAMVSVLSRAIRGELLRERMSDELFTQKQVIWWSFSKTRKRTACWKKGFHDRHLLGIQQKPVNFTLLTESLPRSKNLPLPWEKAKSKQCVYSVCSFFPLFIYNMLF